MIYYIKEMLRNVNKNELTNIGYVRIKKKFLELDFFSKLNIKYVILKK